MGEQATEEYRKFRLISHSRGNITVEPAGVSEHAQDFKEYIKSRSRNGIKFMAPSMNENSWKKIPDELGLTSKYLEIKLENSKWLLNLGGEATASYAPGWHYDFSGFQLEKRNNLRKKAYEIVSNLRK